MSKTAPTQRSRAPVKPGRIGDSVPHAEPGKPGRARAGLPLRWKATEYAPRKRWWWYVAASVVFLWLACFFVVLGNWLGGLVTVLAGVALFRWYLPKARTFDFELTDTELRISSGTISKPLDSYRGFTIEEIPQGEEQFPFELIVLIPKARFGSGLDLYLPGDETEAVRVIERLGKRVPYLDGPGPSRTVNRIIRALRLR